MSGHCKDCIYWRQQNFRYLESKDWGICDLSYPYKERTHPPLMLGAGFVPGPNPDGLSGAPIVTSPEFGCIQYREHWHPNRQPLSSRRPPPPHEVYPIGLLPRPDEKIDRERVAVSNRITEKELSDFSARFPYPWTPKRPIFIVNGEAIRYAEYWSTMDSDMPCHGGECHSSLWCHLTVWTKDGQIRQWCEREGGGPTSTRPSGRRVEIINGYEIPREHIWL